MWFNFIRIANYILQRLFNKRQKYISYVCTCLYDTISYATTYYNQYLPTMITVLSSILSAN